MDFQNIPASPDQSVKSENLNEQATQSSNNKDLIDINLEYENFLMKENQKEKIKNVSLSQLSGGQGNQRILLSLLLQRLKDLDYNFQKQQLFYKGPDQYFIYVGTLPNFRDVFIPITNQNVVHLKIRKAVSQVNIESIPEVMESPIEEEIQTPIQEVKTEIQEISVQTPNETKAQIIVSSKSKEEIEECESSESKQVNGKVIKTIINQVKIKQMISLVNE